LLEFAGPSQLRTRTGPEPRLRSRFAVPPGPDLQVWFRFRPEVAEPEPDRTLASVGVWLSGEKDMSHMCDVP